MTDETEQIEAANEDLETSLEQCRYLVADLRSKLAANSNDRFVVRAMDRSGSGNE